jgi:hypothetical protein
MEIRIDGRTRISEIKKEFSLRFPYLKIEFFKVPHKVGESSPKSTMISRDAKVGDIRKDGEAGRINFSGMMTVGELEQKFQDLFGVSIQVFRKSGKSWIQTTVTDNWTLTEQNNKAYELDHEIIENEPFQDY